MTNKIYVLQKPELVVGAKDFKVGAEFGIDSELTEIYFMREINSLKTLVVFESEFKLAFEDKALIIARKEKLKKEQEEKEKEIARKKWKEEELKAATRHVHTDIAGRHMFFSQNSVAEEEKDKVVHDTLSAARSTDSSSSSSSSYDSGSSSSYDSGSSSYDSGSW